MEEIWRDIENFEGQYQISNFGNIRQLHHFMKWANGHIKEYSEELYDKIGSNGNYLNVRLPGHREYIHRVVAKAFPEICGEWFDSCEIDHIDTNKLNNRADNLRVCTRKENMNNPLTVQRNREHHPDVSGMNNPFYGKLHTEESKKKMSENQKGRKSWNSGKTGIYNEDTMIKIRKNAHRKFVFEDENGQKHIMDKRNKTKWHPNWVLLYEWNQE